MMQRLGKFFIDTAEVVVFAVTIFLFIYLLLIQPHKIKGSSMEPNFHNGQYLLSDKLSYRFNEPNRGDVIIFRAPKEDGEEFIKRIIGLPGDKIKIEGNKVYVNDKQLIESYIPDYIPTSPGAFLKLGSEVIVPESSFFVLGDNRNHSSDSRSWGFITKKDIKGKAWIIYWPPSTSGKIPSPTY